MNHEQPKTILAGRPLTCLESIGALALVFGAVALLIGLKSCGASSSSPPVAAAVAAAAPPTPAPIETPRALEVATDENPPGLVRPAIKGSRAAFRSWFEKLGIHMTKSSPVDGAPREMGSTPDKLMNVETIGHGDLIEKATLLFAIDRDNIESVATATGSVMVFMRETGWNGGHTWAIEQLKKPSGGKKTKNGVDYEVSVPMPGMFILSARPAAAAAKH